MDWERDIGELLERARTGDHDAFEELYQLACGSNFNVIRKIVKNDQDAQDVLQDTWIKIYEKLNQIQGTTQASFVSWSGRIASNTALDFLRKRRPLLFSELEQDSEFNEMSFDIRDFKIENQPELAFDQKETVEIVNELLEQLPDDQRICIVMFYLQEMSILEIAETLGCPESTVKSRLNYARKKIQAQEKALEKKGIHLHGMAPMLLLGCLLRSEAASAQGMSGRMMFSGLFMKDGIAQGRFVGNWISKAGGRLAGVAGKKLFIGIMAVIVGTGGVFGSYALMQKQNISKEDSAVMPEQTSPPAASSRTRQPESASPEPTAAPTPQPTPTKKPRESRKPKAKKSAPTARPTSKPASKPKKKNNDLELGLDPDDLDSGW